MKQTKQANELLLLSKHLDARAFTEILDHNAVNYQWLDVDDISNPNYGMYQIEVEGIGAMFYIDGQLDSIS